MQRLSRLGEDFTGSEAGKLVNHNRNREYPTSFTSADSKGLKSVANFAEESLHGEQKDQLTINRILP